MDAIDQRIVKELQQNGRISNQELSERVGLSPSPCLRRVRSLESRGVIMGYAAIIDEALYGLPVIAFVRVRVSPHTREVVSHFERSIRDIDAVVDCYVITGDADYLLKVLAKSPSHYEETIRHYLHKIEGITAIDTSFAYGVTKRSAVIPASRTLGSCEDSV